MCNTKILPLVLVTILTTLGCGGKDKAAQNTGPTPLSDEQKDVQNALRELGAIVHGSNVVQVQFRNSDLTTDAAMTKLQSLKNLSMVDLADMKITDDGLKTVCAIDTITDLNLRGTNTTDAGMAHVKNLSKLSSITVGPQIGDAGVAHLAGIKTLKTVRLDGSKVTDAALKHIASCPRLNRLSLVNCNITDTGLAYLKDLKRLVILSVPGTKITDAGLVHLEGHSQMAQIHLYEVKGVTEAGLAKLRKILSQTDVEGGVIRESPLGNPLGAGNPGPTEEQKRTAETKARRPNRPVADVSEKKAPEKKAPEKKAPEKKAPESNDKK